MRLSRRAAGWALVGSGVVMLVIGLIGLLGDSAPREPLATDTTTTTSEATTTSEVTITTTTTSTVPTTTTSTIATTTTTAPSQSIEEFIEEFDAAIESDDEAFLFDRLHPVVLEAYGEGLCREWISREIVELSDYQLAGEPGEPEPRTIQTPEGEREIDVITAPITFTFQGETFQASGGFALVDGLVHWVGECR